MSWLRRSRSSGPSSDPTARARERMVRDQIEARGVRDPEVLAVMRRVPRHRFVDSAYAYEDRALPLLHGQTISQPFVVALMTQIARPPDGWAGARALEVGTGSGYQAAVLAELGASVVTVERDPELAAGARANLDAAGYDRVQTEVGDGTGGWPPGAPYDAILVTAAGPEVPDPLRQQLASDGGRLVIPIGSRDGQWLTVVERHADDWHERAVEPVVFVPLIGAHGYQERQPD